jgi:hypothetical protein
MRTVFLIAFPIILIISPFAITQTERAVAQPRKDELVSFSVTSAKITLHEPLIIDFVVNNTHAETLTFDLGPDRKENFRFTFTRPGGATQAQQLRKEGVARLGKVTIQPGESYKQQLLVNEWFDIPQPGNYTVSIEMITPIVSQKGQVITKSASNRFTIEVLPRDPEKLKDICESLFTRITTSNSHEQASESATTLSFISDSVAVPYLEKMLKIDNMIERIAIKGLARVNNSEAVEALINALNLVVSEKV